MNPAQKQFPNFRVKVEAYTEHGTPRRMSNVEGVEASRDPVKTAKRAVAALARKLRIAADLSLTVVSSEKVSFPVKDVPRQAIKLVLVSTKPRGEWKVYVDLVTGKVLAKVRLLKDATGKGRVFDPNPVVALDDSTLKDSTNVPDAAYREVDLQGLEGKGFLDGPFVTTRTTPGRVKKANLDFRFRRGKKAFTEAMVYFHIDRVQ